MSTLVNTELAFEEAIEASLLQSGYVKDNSIDYNKEFCVDEKLLFAFLQTSQPEKWTKSYTPRRRNDAQVICDCLPLSGS